MPVLTINTHWISYQVISVTISSARFRLSSQYFFSLSFYFCFWFFVLTSVFYSKKLIMFSFSWFFFGVFLGFFLSFFVFLFLCLLGFCAFGLFFIFFGLFHCFFGFFGL